MALQTPCFTAFDWVQELQKCNCQVTFISCSDEWLDRLKASPGTEDNAVKWNSVDLGIDAPMPVFAFFYSGESFPFLQHGRDFNQLPLTECQFYADIKAYQRVQVCLELMYSSLVDINEQARHATS